MIFPMLLTLALQAPLPVEHVHQAQHLVSITGTPLELLRLTRIDLDTIQSNLAEGQVVVLADDEELAAIRGLGLQASVEIDDLAGFYARRLRAKDAGSPELSGSAASTSNAAAGGPYGQGLSPQFGQGSMGGYYTYDEIGSVLDQMSATYPDLITPKVSIGSTLEGRAIWMVKVSDNPGVDEAEPEVRIDAMHHAREPQGMQTTLYFLSYLLEEYGTDPLATYLINEREIYVLPCVNPDGYEFNRSQAPGGGGLWRKNRRSNADGTVGVDLNRNYPFQWGGGGSSGNGASETFRGVSPSSEPETTAMIQFIESRDFKTALSVHTFSDLWLSPWGYVAQLPPDWIEIQEIGEAASSDNGYAHGPASIILNEADGVTIDYDYGVHDTYSWTPEIGSSTDGFWPAQNRILPLAEDNRLAFARTVLAAGPWIRPQSLVITEEGDLDGTFEPGEDVVVDVFVRNSGREDSGIATVNMTVASPFVSVSDDNSILTVGSFMSAQNTAPLRFVIDPAVPFGTEIPIAVTVTEGGRSFEMTAEIAIGRRTVAAFDFESADNEGWTVGAPNDATTGEWTRADPVGTAAQPENDNSSGLGVNCWFTGQGVLGGVDGANDVDGGSTTLISPAFDVAGAQEATLRYARWYSNSSGATPNADVFQVDLSDDNGASWVSAEVVGPAGPGTSGGWQEVELDLGQFVALSSTVRVRFIASDLGAGSIVEAAIDDVQLFAFEAPTCAQPVNYCPLTPNSSTSGAIIDAQGSTDVGQNSLTLTVSNANANNFGLFFYGQGRAQVPVGNGNVCIAGNFTRLPAVATDAAGFASYALDFPSLPAPIVNGETWNFQFWLRDVGGAGVNFSNGLEIQFCQP